MLSDLLQQVILDEHNAPFTPKDDPSDPLFSTLRSAAESAKIGSTWSSITKKTLPDAQKQEYSLQDITKFLSGKVLELEAAEDSDDGSVAPSCTSSAPPGKEALNASDCLTLPSISPNSYSLLSPLTWSESDLKMTLDELVTSYLYENVANLGPNKKRNRLYYRTIGTGEKCILMIHGLAMTSNFWLDGIILHLPPEVYLEYTVICVDLMGYGQSISVPSYDNYSAREQAQRIKTDIIDALNISQLHILAHSFGGVVAMHLAYLIRSAAPVTGRGEEREEERDWKMRSDRFSEKASLFEYKKRKSEKKYAERRLGEKRNGKRGEERGGEEKGDGRGGEERGGRKRGVIMESIILLSPAVFSSPELAQKSIGKLIFPANQVVSYPLLSKNVIKLIRKIKKWLIPITTYIIPSFEMPLQTLQDFFDTDADCATGTISAFG